MTDGDALTALERWDDCRVVADHCVGPRRRWPYLWQALNALLFPSRCAACKRFWFHSSADGHGAVMSTDPLRHARGYLCPDCLGECQRLDSPMCLRCGLMFKTRIGGDHRCSDCLTDKGYYGMARAVGIYQGGLMDFVHQLKYQGRLALVPPMGRMLRDTYRHYWDTRPVDLVVPVPLHPRRLRRRGFNQAVLLLRAWQQAAGDAATAAGPDGLTDVLVRVRRTPPQTGLNRRERRRNIRGAFKVVDREGIRKQRLLLLDDVFTTGATVEEAARMLLAAGAISVDVLTFARTLR